MAAEEAIAAGVFELRADADQFVSAVANAQQTAERFERATVAAFTRAGKSSGELGNADIRSWVRETERLITANERQAASAALSGSALQQLKAQGKGISEEVYSPLVAALKDSEANLLKFNRAVEQARNVAAFDRIVADSEKLGQVSKNIDSITAALDRLEGEERQAGQTRVFDSRVAEAAKLGLAEQYMRRYQDAAGDLAVAERAFAADAAFVQGLKRRSDAIGKTQADLLELEAAERGVSAQAAPMIARLREQERALGIYSGGARDARVSTNQLRTAMAQLPAQFTDVFTSLAGGQNPLLVLIQQGGQIRDSFQGTGNALRGIGAAIAAAFTPAKVLIGGALTVMSAFAAGVVLGEQEMTAYRQALVLTGNAAGTTAGQLQATAEAVSRTVGTQGKAAEAIAALAATGRVAGRDLGLLAEAAIRLEREGGPAVKDTVAAFAELGKAPTQGALKLNETTRFLTVSVLEQIRALEEQGKVTEAARVAQEAYATASVARTKELESQLGTLERAMRGVSDIAKGMWDAILDVGRPESPAKRIESISKALEGNARRTDRGDSRDSFGNVREGGDAQRARLLEELKAANRSVLNQTEAAAGAVGNLTEEYEKSRKAYEKWADAGLTKQQLLTKELQQYHAALRRVNETRVAAGQQPVSASQQAAEEAAIRKRVLGLKDVEDKYQTVRDAAKEWADAIKDGQKIQADAEATTLGLTKAQERLVEYLSSAAYKTHSEEMRQVAVQTLVAAHNAEVAADAKKKQAKATEELLAAQIKSAVELDKAIAGEERELQTLRDKYVEITAGKSALAEMVALREEEAAAMWERNAAQAAADGLDAAEYLRMQRMAETLRNQAKLHREIAAATDRKETEEANRKAAEDALREWQRTNDQIGQSLADALMEGGKSAGEYLKGLFRSMVLRPIIQGIVQPVAGAVTAFLGVAGGAPGAGGGALGSAMQGASLANNIYQAYNGGGIAGSALAAGNYATVASGSAYGTGFASQQSMALAAQEAGMVSQAGSGAMASWGAYAGYAALIAAAAQYGSRLYDKGWTGSENLDQTDWYRFTPESMQTDLLKGIGLSDKWAEILGGSVRLNHMFGLSSTKVEGQGVLGTLSAGGFSGNSYVDTLRERGWVASAFGADDERDTIKGALPTALGGFISEAASSVYREAAKFGAALGLAPEALSTVSTNIKVKLGNDAKANKEELAKALGTYGDDLVKAWADAVAPVAQYGETTAETIARVGTALLGVNSVLNSIGMAAIETSVSGGRAALELQNLFGGLDNMASAVGGYYSKFYSEGERVTALQKSLAGTFAEYGAVLPTTRAEFRALVDEVVAGSKRFTDGTAQEQFATLIKLSGAFDELITGQENLAAAEQAVADAAADAAAKVAAMAEQIATGLDSIVGDFISGPDLAQYRAGRIAATLRGGGIEATAEGVLASDRDDIVALWRTVGDAGKEAILKAYGAWQTLKEGIAAGLQDQIDAIVSEFGDLSVIDEPVKTLSESYVENRDRLRELEEGLTSLVGSVGRSVQEVLADMLASQRALAEYRTSLSDAIADANLRSLTPGARVDALRAQEATLFAQLGSAADPVAAAQRLQGVIVARIKEEVALRQQAAEAESALVRDARERQMDALRDQISAAERLSDLAKDIAQFTASTRFSELSPLSARDQLAAARTLFDTTLAAAPTDENAQRNLLTNAQAYLQELASFAPVGTEQYANEFARVMGALDELGLSGADSNPVVSALQDQLAVLEAVNDSQALQEALARESAAMEAAAFTQMQSVLGSVKEAQDRAIEAQLKVAQEEIAQRDKILKNQEAQITQQAAIVKELTDTMKELWAETTEDRIAGSQPTSGFVGGVRER